MIRDIVTRKEIPNDADIAALEGIRYLLERGGLIKPKDRAVM